jgi:hypothetical protein
MLCMQHLHGISNVLQTKGLTADLSPFVATLKRNRVGEAQALLPVPLMQRRGSSELSRKFRTRWTDSRESTRRDVDPKGCRLG